MVKSPEELLKVSLGVVPSVPKILMFPPLIVRSPVAVSIWKVVLSGTPVEPPLVIVKNWVFTIVEPLMVSVFSVVKVPAIFVLPVAESTVNLLKPEPALISPKM